MFTLIRFYLQQNLLLIGMILFFIVGGTITGWDLEVIPLILIWILAYRLNTEEKVKNNWSFFHALPLSLPAKAGIKIGFPLILLSLLLIPVAGETFFVSDQDPLHPEWPGAALVDKVSLAAFLVFCSLLSRSMMTWVLSGVFVLALHHVFYESPWYAAALIVLILGASLWLLSERRLDFRKTMSAAALAAVLPATLLWYACNWQLGMMLESEDPEQKLTAIHLMLEEDHRSKEATTALVALLHGNPSDQNLVIMLRIMHSHDPAVHPGRKVWEGFIRRSAKVRRYVFRYLADRPQTYSWTRTLEFIRFAEARAIHPGQQCEADCEVLAEMTGGTMLNLPGGEEHLRGHLTSAQPGRVGYGLAVLDEQETVGFPGELATILEQSNDEENRRRARQLLEDWKTDELGENIGREIGRLIDRRLNKSLSREERRKIKRIIDRELQEQGRRQNRRPPPAPNGTP